MYETRSYLEVVHVGRSKRRRRVPSGARQHLRRQRLTRNTASRLTHNWLGSSGNLGNVHHDHVVVVVIGQKATWYGSTPHPKKICRQKREKVRGKQEEKVFDSLIFLMPFSKREDSRHCITNCISCHWDLSLSITPIWINSGEIHTSIRPYHS